MNDISKDINWFWYWENGPASGSIENMPCGLTIGSIIISSFGKYEVVDILSGEAINPLIDIENENDLDIDMTENNIFIILSFYSFDIIDKDLSRHLKIGNILD